MIPPAEVRRAGDAPPERSPGQSRASRSDTHTDQAALLGAAVAVILAIILSSGPWGWIPTAVGLTIVSVIVGFAQFTTVDFRQAVALASVLSLALALTLGWPTQVVLRSANIAHVRSRCEEAARDAARVTARQEGASVDSAGPVSAGVEAQGNCLGVQTNTYLWVVTAAAFVFTLLAICFAKRLSHVYARTSGLGRGMRRDPRAPDRDITSPEQ